MFTRQNLFRLILAALLLALLAVPVLNAAVSGGMAALDSPDSTALFQSSPTGGGMAIACNTGDPGGGQGTGC